MQEDNPELLFFKSRLGLTESLLMFKQRQIDAILEITRAINQNLPLVALSRILEATFTAQLDIAKSALLLKQQDWEIVYFHAQDYDSFLESKSSYIDFFRDSKIVSKLENTLFEVGIPVFIHDELIGVLLLGDFQSTTDSLKEEKIKFAQTLANMICVAYENKRLLEQESKQKLVERDLFLASEIQRVLIPFKFPETPHFDVSAFYKPYRNIGGDYYDFFKISEGRYFFCMCDISGKGIAAAMLMANFQASLRFTMRQNIALIDSVQILNRSLFEVTKGDSFITAFFGVLDCASCTLEYVNAGHNSPFIFQSGEVKELTTGCTLLGFLEQLPVVKSEVLPIIPNSVLVAYTDGITEASNEEEELYGEERLKEFFVYNKDHEPELINIKLIQSIMRFSNKDFFDDDLSLMTIRFNGNI
jgi:sigma-B regulation protein RsbU (phosphoserine phosphatase)